jgi:hypothetical protein
MDRKGAVKATSVPDEMISDNASKYKDGDPKESEKRGGPGDLRNFGIATSYDRSEKASEYGEGREYGGEKIEKLC